MRHLAPNELIDCLEGTLPPARVSHVASCHRCAADAAELKTLRDEVARVPMDEPSPLFWDHLAAQVREAVNAEPLPARTHGWTTRTMAWLAGAAAIVVALVGTLVMLLPLRVASDEPAGAVPALADLLGVDEPGSVGGGSGWALVALAAEDLDWDEAAGAGLGAAPGAADRALHQLTDAERRELVRLLQAELARLKS